MPTKALVQRLCRGFFFMGSECLGRAGYWAKIGLRRTERR